MNRIVTVDRKNLSREDHEKLAEYLANIEQDIHRMLNILSGKARSKWLDYLLKNLNGKLFGKLRSALDEDFLVDYQASSPYYGRR